MTVWTPGHRFVGGLTALGGLLALVASVPTRWVGPMPTDSYVFDPPRFSALWFERAVVPAVALAAVLLTVLGLIALYRRDRERLARWQRWTAVVALIGAGIGTLATVLLVTAGRGTMGDPTNTLNALLGAALALLALLLLFPGLLAWGVGYLRSDRPVLGAAVAGGPVLPVLVVAVSIALDVDGSAAGSLPVVLPAAAAVAVVGRDLWMRAG
ncbi:hypothetical protein [Haloplanus halophilus]|uniref:hypothetical protein n=1 Tax=Haloplanus halophilus TaxID=2949993 RepID=UPI00203CE54E|nr:hypothetical protein [Haloplanus sp. GDY1]